MPEEDLGRDLRKAAGTFDPVRPQDLGIGRLFESVRDAVIVAEAHTGRIVLWNLAASKIFGYPLEEALGLRVEALVPERLRARHRAGIARYRDTGHGPYVDSGEVLDLPAVRKGGEEIRVEMTLSPIRPARDGGPGTEEGEGGRLVLAIVRDVTERKRAEEELRRLKEELEERVEERTARLEAAVNELKGSEERYRLLVEGAKDYAIFMVDTEGRVTNWNSGARRLFGYEEGEIVGEDGSVLFTPEDRRRGVPEEELRRAETEGRAVDERWHVRKDGTRFWTSGFTRPVLDGDGNLIGFAKVARDITERKRSEERTRFLADLDRALQPLTDPDEVTAAAARMLGEHLQADRCAYAEVEADEDRFRITGDYTASGVPSIVGRFAMSEFGAQALRLMRANEPYVVADAEADERVSETDLAAYRQTRIRAVVSVPLHKGGRFVAGMAVHQKTPRRWSREEVELVTTVANRCWESIERARAERNLRRSEERYRSLVAASTSIVWTVDPEGRFAEPQPSWEAYTGQPWEEHRGFGWTRALHPDDRGPITEAWQRARDRRTLYESEGRLWHAPSRSYRHFAARATPLSDADGSVREWVGMINDVDDRKRAEDALRLLAEASEALASSLDYRETLSSVARLAVPRIADWCAVDVLAEDGSLQRLAVEHEDPGKVALAYELQERYPPDPDAPGGVHHVLRSGEPEMAPEIPARLVEEAVRDERHGEILRELDLRSYMVVPLVARGRTLGAITLATAESGRRYGQADLRLAEDLARRAAVAVDNARLYEGAQEEIAERKEAEGRAREAERRYRSIFENAVDGVFQSTPDGRLLTANPALARIFGYDSPEAMVSSVADVARLYVDPHERAEYLRSIERHGSVSGFECRARRKDGGVIWISLSARVSRDEIFGEPTVFEGTVEDVTERKEAEEKLRASLKELSDMKLALDESTIVAFTDVRGRITYANDRFCEISKYPREELIGRDHRIINSGYHPKGYIRNLWRTIAGGRVWRGELRNRAKDGSIYWVDTTIVPFRNERGKPYRYVAIRHDITEHKRAEEEVRRQAELLDLSHEPILAWELGGGIVYWNRGCEELYGFAKEEALGRVSHTLLQTTHPQTLERIEASLEREGRWDGELEHTTRDGRRVVVESRHLLVGASDGRRLVLEANRDITEHKKAEEALREVREAERSRMARDLHDGALQDLTYALAEAQIAQMVPDAPERDERLRRAVEALRRAARGVHEAVYDLRLEGALRRSWLSALEDVVELNHRMAHDDGYRIQLIVEEGVEGAVDGVFGGELVRVVREALTNARRHSGAKNVRVVLGLEGDGLAAEVSDDGRGFEPGSSRGGVGMSSMRQRAEALGGKLRVESEPGKGTTVRVRLPLSVAAIGQTDERRG